MADISKFKDLQGTTYDLKDTTARGMVSANPTLAGTESELTSIKIGENKYKIASGTIRPGTATTVNGLLKGNGSSISAFTQYLPAEPKTSAEYAVMVAAGTVDPTVAYVITDDQVAPIDVIGKADKADLASIRAIAPTNTTGSTISAGTYFYLDNVLVKALADIASGATFTNNTNYSVVTAGGLNDLKSAFTPSLWYSQEFSANALPTVALPSGWKMLFVAVYVDASYRCYTYTIPRDFLWNTGNTYDDGFTVGFYVASNDFGRASIIIKPDGSTISVVDTNASSTADSGGKLIVSYI